MSVSEGPRNGLPYKPKLPPITRLLWSPVVPSPSHDTHFHEVRWESGRRNSQDGSPYSGLSFLGSTPLHSSQFCWTRIKAGRVNTFILCLRPRFRTQQNPFCSVSPVQNIFWFLCLDRSLAALSIRRDEVWWQSLLRGCWRTCSQSWRDAMAEGARWHSLDAL